MSEPPSLTEQLRCLSGRDREFAEAVLRGVLPELYRIAMRELGRSRHDSAFLSATELINETWLRNFRKGGWQINNRQHFYAIAALAMRQVLIDLARLRTGQRRAGFHTAAPLNEEISGVRAPRTDAEALVEIGMLMERLEKRNPQIARIVDMHYFAGFTFDEIAGFTGFTSRQVRHYWETGRDWLKDKLVACA
jgi:RNA polymerase sigma factor (TIGR02999 family)